MNLPNFENAVIDMRKLSEYALDPESPRGHHKARVFKAALGLTSENAEDLRNAILAWLPNAEAVIGEADFYGKRFTVDCKIKTDVGEAIVRTCWIVRQKENFPRLTSCYVLKERKEL
jgi:hypothetical protein